IGQCEVRTIFVELTQISWRVACRVIQSQSQTKHSTNAPGKIKRELHFFRFKLRRIELLLRQNRSEPHLHCWADRPRKTRLIGKPGSVEQRLLLVVIVVPTRANHDARSITRIAPTERSRAVFERVGGGGDVATTSNTHGTCPQRLARVCKACLQRKQHRGGWRHASRNGYARERPAGVTLF